MKTVFAFAFFWIVSSPLFAFSIPELKRPVHDEAALLNSADTARIENFLRAFEQTSKIQMAILITPSLEGADIESYSIEVAKKWKLGSKGKDQGLLLVIAPKERRMRLEVGYGLEGDLTDAFCRRVLQNGMGPYFKAGRYADGILIAIEWIAEKLSLDLRAPVSKRMQTSNKFFWVVFLFILFCFAGSVLPLLFFGRRLGGYSSYDPYRRRGWGGSDWGGGGGWSSGGGGFSGGGGSFGGGGASSSW